MEFTVERKGHGRVLLTWVPDILSSAQFTVLRAVNDAEPFSRISVGRSTAYVDATPEVALNRGIRYQIVGDDGTHSDIKRADEDPDPLIEDVAETYLWRLDQGLEGIPAVAFCKSGQVTHCPECWSEELNKRIKSNCSTCDGSGMIDSYKGGIPFHISFAQTVESIGVIDSVEVSTKRVGAWTGNLPLFNRGDVIIVGADRYMVNKTPQTRKMVSEKNKKYYIVKQTLELQKLDVGHALYKLGVNDE